MPGLENTLVACLERIFKTKYGASLIPQYMVCLLLWSFWLKQQVYLWRARRDFYRVYLVYFSHTLFSFLVFLQSFVQLGLRAESQLVRCLACKTVCAHYALCITSLFWFFLEVAEGVEVSTLNSFAIYLSVDNCARIIFTFSFRNMSFGSITTQRMASAMLVKPIFRILSSDGCINDS